METAILCYIAAGLVVSLLMASLDRDDPLNIFAATMVAIVVCAVWPLIVISFVLNSCTEK